MTLTDEFCLNLINELHDPDFTDDITHYDEEDRANKSDKEIVLEELKYFITMYEKEGYLFHNSLVYAKRFIKKTKNGTKFILSENNFQKDLEDNERRYKESKELVDRYTRLKMMKNILKKEITRNEHK